MPSNHKHNSTVISKRVFLRLHSSAAPKESEIIQAFLKQSGYAAASEESEPLHFIHSEPPQYSWFHVIIDINYVQISSPNLALLPHEVYKVNFEDNGNTP